MKEKKKKKDQIKNELILKPLENGSKGPNSKKRSNEPPQY